MEKIKVLLIEDDEDDYLITRRLLNEIDSGRYELAWARSYKDAQDLTARQDYDVCLVDYRLGEHTGLDVLRGAREAGYPTPMILLTGLGDPEVDLEAMRAGAADYLVKNQLNAALLERSIRYSIEQFRNERERLRLAKERAEAESAIIARDEFIALISHEMRNPLTSILGWANVLASGQADAESVAQAAATIERNVEMQKRLIDDLLDIARVTRGKLRLEAQPIDLALTLNEALDTVRFSAGAKGVDLVANLDPGVGQVVGDPARLQQIAWNLLSNAIKFTPPGGRVDLKLSRVGPIAQFQVRDTGRGISPDFLPHVFEQFSQADKASGQRQGGLGLGLALVRRLVEAHGGIVEAASEGENRGATFTVKLPVRSALANEFQAAPVAPVAGVADLG
jgi:signal transduction histidine kinase